ncbi:MAG TPA: antitoxin [Clostridiales bacterium]|jgi:uncharacterized protein (UPF0332 family)|nr:HEPN domain-containing protein [Clostridiales bacterium]HBL82994.1 antitoxin [Clostridiales bacterium]
METKRDLSQYRLEQAEQCLKSAKILLDSNDYKGAANRSYYCVFHCMRSILALEGMDFKKHSGLIAYFRKEYIKTGKLDVALSDIITDVFQIRTESDYDDYYVVNKADVEEQIKNAEYFIQQTKKYLEGLL